GYGALVLYGRDVARVFVERDGLQDAAHDLAAAGLGEHADEVQIPDDRNRPELPPHRLQQLSPQVVRRFGTLSQDHEGRDHLHAYWIRAAGDPRLGHRGMPEEGRLHLDGADPVACDL